MPVAPDAVRETIVLEEPRADEQPEPQGAQAAGTGAAESLSRTRRLLLAGVCVAAFLVGFAVVTVLMHDAGSASKPRSKTTPTSVAPSAPAPVPSTPSRAPASTPPSSALAAQPDPGGAPVPSQPLPRMAVGGAGPQAPATSAPVPAPTTSPPTTTPATTTP